MTEPLQVLHEGRFTVLQDDEQGQPVSLPSVQVPDDGSLRKFAAPAQSSQKGMTESHEFEQMLPSQGPSRHWPKVPLMALFAPAQSLHAGMPVQVLFADVTSEDTVEAALLIWEATWLVKVENMPGFVVARVANRMAMDNQQIFDWNMMGDKRANIAL